MEALGKLPEAIRADDMLNGVEEFIIVANKDYTISWLNPRAVSIMKRLIILFGLENVEQLIGLNMDVFHHNPGHQRKMMKNLKETHRVQINIKDKYIAETLISPIKNKDQEIQGYLLMLLDVTEQVREEKIKEQLIQALSVPIMRIWDDIAALPIVGTLDHIRFDRVMEAILNTCVKDRISHFLIDLSGVAELDEASTYRLSQMTSSLRLIGTQCYLVGIGPELATKMTGQASNSKNFRNIRKALQVILEKNPGT
ncbi:STAS domain-containing protein [Jeotgalibacillus soli]|uniref:STAS domain-containing protein n=1 Tax=Jeotgalibacillus soli TaxID=889306 RepID=A0A0C2R6E9_9BACL|nr:STAS domain-containing protein [Jeotgalibacillus soli]KIL45835.1 hypothetical protein KP78_21840 [Jeotgalibacillus soli]